MATGATYVVQYRRKRSQETDYRDRLDLLKSGKPRLVIRPSNKHIVVQVIGYKPNGDMVLASAKSSDLVGFGWKYAKSNIPAAYLTGLLCGKRATDAKVKDAVMDIGLCRSVKGSRIYAALKGVVDSGLEVAHDEKIFPDESRISGQHTKEAKEMSANAKGVADAIKNKVAPKTIKEVKPKK